jgi:deltex
LPVDFVFMSLWCWIQQHWAALLQQDTPRSSLPPPTSTAKMNHHVTEPAPDSESDQAPEPAAAPPTTRDIDSEEEDGSLDPATRLERDVPKSTSQCWFGKPVTVAFADILASAKDRKGSPPDVLEKETCCICLGPFEPEDSALQLDRCVGEHLFHPPCIEAALKHASRCPACLVPFGALIGTMPDGTMTVVRTAREPLPGFDDCPDTIIVSYSFPGGKQTERHPNPGQRYSGTGRTAYLPYNTEGRRVLALLMKAWDHRVLFTVGQSVTTSADNTTVWNGIHHKTSPTGGPTAFGYPDPTYLKRVTLEIAAFGIT